MKKKIFSLTLLGLITIGINIPLLSITKHNNTFSKEKNEDEFAPKKWQSEMETVLDNENTDYDGEYISYQATNKIYYLKQDIDYQPMIDNGGNIYSSDTNITLIENSTFNGNGHKILNRYDKEELESFIVSNEILFEDFKNRESGHAKDLFLFTKLVDQNLVNLTFNNSPFVTNEIIGFSKLHNVNLENINISELNLNLSSKTNLYSEKQNSFVLPLLAFQMGANAIIENSFFNEINISDNEFHLTQKSNTNMGMNIVISLIMYVNSNNSITSIPGRFRDLEYNHWTITNNKVYSNLWSGNFINKNVITFTPFFVGGEEITSHGFKIPKLMNYQTNSNLSGTKENSIIINNIYFNDFKVLNNQAIVGGEVTQGFNFIILPMFNDDDLIFLSFKTILLGNEMVFNDENLNATNYITEATNTIISYSNLMYSTNISSSLKDEMNKNWVEEKSEKLTSNNFKEFNFNKSFWNVNDGEELSLLKEEKITIDSNLFIDENDDSYINVYSKTNNYFTTYFEYQLSKKATTDEEWTEMTSFTVENAQGIEQFKETFNFKISLKDFELSSEEQLKINIKTSKGDNSFIFEQEINTNQANFLIYNFTNEYDLDKNHFNYSFNLVDPFNQIKTLTLKAYYRNKLLFSDDSLKNKSNLIEGSTKDNDVDVSIKNHEDLYFIFSATYDIYGVKTTTTLIPNEVNTFKISEENENYISDFLINPLTWTHYYWWVILIIVLLILFLFFILLTLISLKRNNKKMHVVEEAMVLWADEHQGDETGIQMFDEFIHHKDNHSKNKYIHSKHPLEENYNKDYNEEDYYDENYYQEDYYDTGVEISDEDIFD